MKDSLRAQRHYQVILSALLALIAVCVLCTPAAARQGTAFTYQGKLTDAGNPANGNYDLQFKLFDTVTVGTGAQQGATLVRVPVAASVGVFTVQLDFGANVFSGADRYLEIGVRPSGNNGAYTVLAPRQPITASPYAIQTLNAQQLGGLPASGFVHNTAGQQAGANFNIDGNGTVGSLNANGTISLGGIPAPATTPGQGRVYFDAASNKVRVSENGGAFVDLIGAGGVNGSGSANSIPFWSAGTTLGNSQITQSVNGVQLPNNVQLGVGAQGNQVTFGSPNGETGMTIAGANGRADVRFDGTTLRLLDGPAGSPPSNGISITPFAVQLPNNVQLAAGPQGNQVAFGTPNTETGMTIAGVSGRADLRYDGLLKLVNGQAGFVPPATNGIAITTAGNVGIGTTTPATKLHVLNSGSAIDGQSTSGSGVYGESAVSSLTAGGVYGKGTGSGSIGVIGESNINNAVGVFGVSTSTTGVGVYARNFSGRALIVEGDAGQSRDKGGLVKAMLFVNADSTIARCYNGITGATTGSCGFNITRVIPGNHTVYRVDFGFQVNDRFLSVTPHGSSSVNIGVDFFFVSSSQNAVDVDLYIPDVDYLYSTANADFMIIIY